MNARREYLCTLLRGGMRGNMITLFRILRCWQLKTKWKLALWRFWDRQAAAVIQDPAALEKKLMDSLAAIIHETNAETPVE